MQIPTSGLNLEKFALLNFNFVLLLIGALSGLFESAPRIAAIRITLTRREKISCVFVSIANETGGVVDLFAGEGVEGGGGVQNSIF